MSNLISFDKQPAPWLAVRIDHHFRHRNAGFHLEIAFEAHAKRTVVFGPSGSGKSSLLRAVAGLLQPDSGQIQIQGKTVWESAADSFNVQRNVPVEKRRVGLVMQTPAVFPHLSVAGNVGFSLRGMDKAAEKEKIAQLLVLVGAEQLATRWPRELSGGQLQRVAIARMLAAEPAILLLDEPFAALDTQSRQQLSENLHRWARQHRVPVLTVTHNLEEAFASGDDVIVMKEGHVVAQGRPQEVLATERELLLQAMGAGVPYDPET